MSEKKPYALLEREFEDLRKLYRSLVNGVDAMNKENAGLREANAVLNDQLINADDRVGISKGIVENHLGQSKEEIDSLVKEIMELKAEIKRLKG